MTKTLKFKGTFTIRAAIEADLGPPIIFSVPHASGAVRVDLDPGNRSAQGVYDTPISDGLWNALEPRLITNSDELAKNLREELREAQIPVYEAVRRVLHLIKYCCHNFELPDGLFSVKDVSWSEDGQSWSRVPTSYGSVGDLTPRIPLDEKSVKLLQRLIDIGFEPLVGMRHYHRAKSTWEPRYKWIDGAIAAELSVKETLIRLEPRLEQLIIEVPSPPVHKLYGTLLEHYGGRKSPKLKQLSEGATKRNHVIHRPSVERLEPQEAITYIFDVYEAIYDLLKILHPDEEAIKFFFHPQGRVS